MQVGSKPEINAPNIPDSNQSEKGSILSRIRKIINFSPFDIYFDHVTRREIKNKEAQRIRDQEIQFIDNLKDAYFRGMEPLSIEYQHDENGIQYLQGLNTYIPVFDPKGRPVLVGFSDPENARVGPYSGVHADLVTPYLDKGGHNVFLQNPEDAFVVEARAKRSNEDWMHLAATNCENNDALYKIHYGMLLKTSETQWENRWIRYWATPAFEDKKNAIRKVNEQGEPLYNLHYYVEGGKYMDPRPPYEKKYNPLQKSIYSMIQWIGEAKSNKPLTLAEIKSAVREDFHQREKLFYDAVEPEKHGLNPLFSKKGWKDSLKVYDALVFATRLSQQALALTDRVEKGKTMKKARLGFLITAGKLLAKNKRTIGALTSFMFWGLLVVQGFSWLFARKDSLLSKELGIKRHPDDISYEFWGSDARGMDNQVHHGMLDKDKGLRLRAASVEEADILPYEVETKERALEGMGLHAISDFSRSQRGSIIEVENKNDCTVAHVLEPNGMSVTYIPSADTEFAKMNAAEALPGSSKALSTIRTLFDKAAADTPILRVTKCGSKKFQGDFINAAEMEREIEQITLIADEKIPEPYTDNTFLLGHDEERGVLYAERYLDAAKEFARLNNRMKYANPNQMPLPEEPATPYIEVQDCSQG